jgi:ubiquinone/menaquinone biosynthesis C-methylase UbiE
MGCGNGWLSALLAGIDNVTVTGMDLNEMELQQARRVFGARKNLAFAEGSINNIDRHKKNDIIIFAAAIQYFPSFDDTIIKALSLLKEGGEIHLLDSHFYKTGELENAIERTRFYFQSLGHPEMAGHYFHHTVASLRGFRHRILFQPGSLKNKILGNKDPFPWICIYDK